MPVPELFGKDCCCKKVIAICCIVMICGVMFIIATSRVVLAVGRDRLLVQVVIVSAVELDSVYETGAWFEACSSCTIVFPPSSGCIGHNILLSTVPDATGILPAIVALSVCFVVASF